MSIEKRNELLDSVGEPKKKEPFRTENDNEAPQSENLDNKKDEKTEKDVVQADKASDIDQIVENVRELAKSFEKEEENEAEQEETPAVKQKNENKEDITPTQPAFEQPRTETLSAPSLMDDEDEEGTLNFASSALYVVAMAVSFGWMYYAHKAGILSLIGSGADIAAVANGLTALCSPLILIWLIVLSCQKRTNSEAIVGLLRKEMSDFSNPTAGMNRRYERDMDALCEQANKLRESTDLSLASINNARQGLREEMEAFANMSRQSEANVVRLTNIMKERMGKLDNLSKALYGRTIKIGEKAEESGDALEKAASGLMKKVGFIETDMGASVDKVVRASETVQGKIDQIKIILGQSVDGLREGADDICERLVETSQRFTKHEDHLDEKSKELMAKSESFDDMLSSRITSLDELYEKLEVQLASSKVSLDEDKQDVEHVASLLKESVDELKDGLGDRVGDVNAVIDDLQETSEALDVRMNARSEEVQRLIDNLEKQGETFSDIGKTTSRRLGEAMSAALSSADVINNAVRKGAETLKNTADNAVSQSHKSSELVIEQLSQLNKANEAVEERIKACTEFFENSKELLEGAAESCGSKTDQVKEMLDDHVDALHVSYSDLQEKLAKLRKSFDEPIISLEETIDRADHSAEKIQTVLDDRVAELSSTGERAVEQAGAIRQMLRGQSQELSNLSGQLSGNIKVINEQLSTQKEHLVGEVEDSVVSIQRVSQSLQDQVSLVSRVSGTVGEKIDALETKISARYDEIQNGASRTFNVLEEVERSFHDRKVSFEDIVDYLKTNVTRVVDDLDGVVIDISDKSDNAVLKSEHLFDTLSRLARDVNDVSVNSSEKLEAVLTNFDDNILKIEGTATTAAQRLKDSSNDLMVSVDKISIAANDASVQVERVGQSIEKQAQDVHLLTDQAALKVENVQRAITERFHDLSTSIGQSVSQLDDVGDKFSRCAVLIDETSDQIEARFVTIGKEARKEIKNLSDVAENTVLIATKAVGRLQEETGDMVIAANKSLSSLTDISEDYAGRSKALNDQMERSIELSQEYGNKVRVQISEIASTSNETADKIVNQVSAMSDKMLDVSKISDGVAKKIKENGGDLSIQAGKLLSVSNKIEQILEGTSDIFVKQSSLLAKASEEAAKQAKTVVESDFHLKREAFFSSARFIVESLHSLSVDLTRLLSGGELPEKMWKSYQKGDKGIFTKHLLQLNDENSFEKIRKKYADDHEFRNYVQRYFRQYEDVYSQAIKNDHGELLSLTFSSSDIGKLYHVLCSLMNHDAVGSDKKIIH